MKRITYVLLAAIVVFAFACQQAEHSKVQNTSAPVMADFEETATSKEAAPPALGSPDQARIKDIFNSAIAKNQDIESEKRLVRTAQLRFKTANTLKTGLAIERIAQNQGGFVLQNHFRENVERYNTRRISKDSVEYTKHVSGQAQLQIRVPYQHLDTTLQLIGQFAQQLGYRNLQAQDVTLGLLEQRLATLRNQMYGATLADDIKNNGEKLRDITAAREREFAAKSGEDIAKIERLKIEDQIKYSTISIDLYEDAQKRIEYKPFEKVEKPWQANIFVRIGQAFLAGWVNMKIFMVWMAKSWPAWLVLAALLYGVRWWRRG